MMSRFAAESLRSLSATTLNGVAFAPLSSFPKKRAAASGIAPFLQKNVDDVAVLIDG